LGEKKRKPREERRSKKREERDLIPGKQSEVRVRLAFN